LNARRSVASSRLTVAGAALSTRRYRIRAALLNEVIEQFGHFGVKTRIGELVPDDGLAHVVDDSLSDGVAGELTFLIEFVCNRIVDASLNDRLCQ
jgi:hypothetical protein